MDDDIGLVAHISTPYGHMNLSASTNMYGNHYCGEFLTFFLPSHVHPYMPHNPYDNPHSQTYVDASTLYSSPSTQPHVHGPSCSNTICSSTSTYCGASQPQNPYYALHSSTKSLITTCSKKPIST
jgi:hypothetical protein